MLSLDQVHALDADVRERVRQAGPGGRSLRELGILICGASEAALTFALTRLRVKKAVRVDDNGRWLSTDWDEA